VIGQFDEHCLGYLNFFTFGKLLDNCNSLIDQEMGIRFSSPALNWRGNSDEAIEWSWSFEREVWHFMVLRKHNQILCSFFTYYWDLFIVSCGSETLEPLFLDIYPALGRVGRIFQSEIKFHSLLQNPLVFFFSYWSSWNRIRNQGECLTENEQCDNAKN